MSHTMRREGHENKRMLCNQPLPEVEIDWSSLEALSEKRAKDEQHRQEWRAEIETKDKP